MNDLKGFIRVKVLLTTKADVWKCYTPILLAQSQELAIFFYGETWV